MLRRGIVERRAGEARRVSPLMRLAGGMVGVIGYTLSPLSWWNDAVVNVPISIAIAAVLYKIWGLDPRLGFATGYWASNVIGMILLVIGGSLGIKGEIRRRDLALGILGATLYTIAAVVLYDIIKGSS